ncbi:hypothetical protein CALVIDRAFT_37921 [Calocera viscosa TUFC12733]|uniref:Uncharacterized protein n=1 Tax=Calocera viscosa (strain TUFC12733) TaxID=1330018 RepID=A0A167NZ46_CALVF|nr:hypothetical protein CALVIDRAFT_37921 [Calocera viscosa TUFC12733]
MYACVRLLLWAHIDWCSTLLSHLADHTVSVDLFQYCALASSGNDAAQHGRAQPHCLLLRKLLEVPLDHARCTTHSFVWLGRDDAAQHSQASLIACYSASCLRLRWTVLGASCSNSMFDCLSWLAPFLSGCLAWSYETTQWLLPALLRFDAGVQEVVHVIASALAVAASSLISPTWLSAPSLSKTPLSYRHDGASDYLAAICFGRASHACHAEQSLFGLADVTTGFKLRITHKAYVSFTSLYFWGHQPSLNGISQYPEQFTRRSRCWGRLV